MSDRNKEPPPTNGDTIRTVCGFGRVTYDSDWSPSRPWQASWRGSQDANFQTLEKANEWFTKKHKTRLNTLQRTER